MKPEGWEEACGLSGLHGVMGYDGNLTTILEPKKELLDSFFANSSKDAEKEYRPKDSRGVEPFV